MASLAQIRAVDMLGMFARRRVSIVATDTSLAIQRHMSAIFGFQPGTGAMACTTILNRLNMGG